MKNILITIYIFLSGEVISQNYCLDPSFGIKGRVINHQSIYDDFATAIAIQSDGKIVVAGTINNNSSSLTSSDIILIRYLDNGSLDNSFGIGGSVITDINGRNDFANSIAIQSNDKIILAGYTNTALYKNDYTLIRYNIDGSLDTSFGVSGLVLTDIMGSDNATSIVIQPDGKIIAGGTSGSSGLGFFTAVRYTPEGNIDNTFGVNGKIINDFGTGSPDDHVRRVLLQPDGKIILTGEADTDSPNFEDFGLIRYDKNGSVDSSFGLYGKVTTDFGNDPIYKKETANSAALQTDGKIIVVGGGVGGHIIIARYLSNGNLDNSFGIDGKVIGEIGSANAVDIQSDGKILVAGRGSYNEFVLIRYNINGTIDSGFCIDGIIKTNFSDVSPSPGGSSIFSIAIQTDDKIISAGQVLTSPNGSHGYNYDIALAKYDILNITSDNLSPSENEISIFPNPVNDVINIQVSNLNSRQIKFDIHNTLGEVIISNKYYNATESIDVSYLNPGIYILTIKSAEGYFSKQFVKL